MVRGRCTVGRLRPFVGLPRWRAWLRGAGQLNLSPDVFWRMTLHEFVPMLEGFWAAKGNNPDRLPFMTPDETRALEAECRASGLIH